MSIPPDFARIVAGVLCMLAAADVASAGFTPELERIEPRGGQRGTQLELQLIGKRLDDLEEIIFYQPGISVDSLAVSKPEETVARVTIAADAALGEHVMRLRTRRGLTYLRSFWVGPYPTVMEVEPNNSAATGQRLAGAVTVQGVAESEDVDHYLITAKKGERISVEVEGMRLGRVLFDPAIAILGPDGVQLAASDDTPLLRQDPFLSIIAPVDGDFTVLVREASYEGSGASQYRMHVGNFTRPTAVFPPAAIPGTTATFRMLGDPLGAYDFTVAIPADASNPFMLHPVRDGEVAPGGHPIRISALPATNESGENTEQKSATPFPAVPGAVHGIVTAPAPDTFSFSAKKGETWRVQVYARSLRSPLDAYLSVRAADGKSLADNDDQDGPDSRADIEIPADGTYFVSIRDQLNRCGPEFFYRIEITPKPVTLAANPAPADRNDSQKDKVIPVPRGNRYAMVANLTRQNIGCEAVINAAGLPAGVTLEVATVAKSVSSFPMVFEASADAPLGGGLFPLNLNNPDPQKPVAGSFSDTINHIEQNNVGVFHSTRLDRLAIAVTEPVPVRIDVDPPAVPIVKNGTLTLKVRAQRAPGFDGPVKLRMPWTPPGIGAPVDITLEKGSSEAEMTINANSEANPATWNICLVGTLDTPEGPAQISTALVPLTVADPYLGMTIEMAATVPGRDFPLLVKVDNLKDFSGEAKVKLIGLPHGVTAEDLPLAHGQAELKFLLKVAADAAVGKHASLFCEVRVPENNQFIVHQLAQGGTLRIDQQRPVAKAEAPPAAAPAAAAKPLSRLEELRQSAKP